MKESKDKGVFVKDLIEQHGAARVPDMMKPVEDRAAKHAQGRRHQDERGLELALALHPHHHSGDQRDSWRSLSLVLVAVHLHQAAVAAPASPQPPPTR